MKNLKRKKGFTIVELVIVIAVIGVLSAILIPTFSGLIAESKAKSLQLGLRNSYAAYAYAAQDNAKEESAVYLSKDATLNSSSEVYYLDSASGEWKKVNSVTPSEYVIVAEPAGPHSGYYVYIAKA